MRWLTACAGFGLATLPFVRSRSSGASDRSIGGEKWVEFWFALLMMLPFMSRLGHRVSPGQPGSRVWWVRVLVTGVFLVWYNAVAVHLLLEPHSAFHGHSHPVPIGDCGRGQMHSHEDDCHPPHLASDHGYLLTVRTLGQAVLDFILTDASSVEPPYPADGRPSGVLERPHRPGVDPPDPTQPRAPPFV